MTARSALLFALIAWGPNAVAEVPADASEAPSSSRQDFMYLATERPVVLRFEVTIDGVGFRERRLAVYQKLFDSLDADRDGFLNADEQKQIPPTNRLAAVGIQASTARAAQFDREPKDGKIDLHEFQRFAEQAAGDVFRISVAPSESARGRRFPNERPDLFAILDGDRDGFVTPEEFSGGFRNLRRLDFNENGLLSGNEIPGRPASDVNGNNEVLTRFLTPIQDIGSKAPDTIIRSMTGLYDRYGRNAAGILSKDGRLAAAEIHWSDDVIARYDTKPDQALDSAELRALLDDPPSDVALRFDLRLKEGGSTGEILVRPDEGDSLMQISEVSGSSTSAMDFTLAGTKLRLAAVAKRLPRYADVAQAGGAFFDTVDADKNEYLDENELRVRGIPRTVLDATDLDGNRQVFKDEFQPYFEWQDQLSSTSLRLAIVWESRELIDEFDANLDGQLSLRELQEAEQRFTEFDVDGDGRFPRDALTDRPTTIFQVGSRNELDQFLPGRDEIAPPDRAARRPGRIEGNFGPEWFRKMDVNRDGDVSRREFLGTREWFDNFDVDADGLLSLIEVQTPPAIDAAK